MPSPASPSDRSEVSFEERNREFLVDRLRILIWIALAGLATYAYFDVNDYGWASRQAANRFVPAFGAIVMLLGLRRQLFQRYAEVLLVVTACMLSFTGLSNALSDVPAAAEGDLGGLTNVFRSSRFGLTLVFVGSAAIVPVQWRTHLVIQIASIAFFYSQAPDLFAALATAHELAGLLVGLIWICVVCDLSVFLYSRLQRSEFEVSRELEEVSRERKAHLDGLVGIGISATSTDTGAQARTALDEMIHLLGAERGYLYLLDGAGRMRFQVGRDASRADVPEPTGDAGQYLEVPLSMRDHPVGALFLEKAEGGDFSAADEDFLRALASHVAIALETARSTEEISAARDQALAASQAKDAFLQTMGHELRTPLNAVMGYSEMLTEDLDEAGDPAHIAAARKVYDAAAHLLAIIADILDLTELEAERASVHLESIPVTEAIAAVEAEIRPLAGGQGNRFEVAVAEEVGSLVSDRPRVELILKKLLENACKFTSGGKVRLEVSRSGEEGTACVRFRVTDTGIGMTEEQLGRCFEPFYQADSSATREYGGTGLGLTTAVRLCEILGGSITARSAPGEGSTFDVTLPTEGPERIS